MRTRLRHIGIGISCLLVCTTISAQCIYELYPFVGEWEYTNSNITFSIDFNVVYHINEEEDYWGLVGEYTITAGDYYEQQCSRRGYQLPIDSVTYAGTIVETDTLPFYIYPVDYMYFSRNDGTRLHYGDFYNYEKEDWEAEAINIKITSPDVMELKYRPWGKDPEIPTVFALLGLNSYKRKITLHKTK